MILSACVPVRRLLIGRLVVAASVLVLTQTGRGQSVETAGAKAIDQKNAEAFHATFATEAVAADHPIASQAGAEILAKGGNAVDAAVATSFTLSVVRPFSCGIGGGGFMLISLPARERKPAVTVALNYRETCPQSVGPDYFQTLDGQPDASIRGGRSVATPGTILGLLHALERYGTMDRATVLAPAIRAARDGFIADEAYAKAAASTIKKFEANADEKVQYDFLWRRFLGSGAVKVGDRIRCFEQAAALEDIARNGDKAVLDGDLGDAIVAAAEKAGGELRIEDLRKFTVVESEPIRMPALGRTFLSMPPPSSGGIALAQTLGILERRHPKDIVESGNQAIYLHTLTECFKHAFADRAEWLADSAYVEVPVARLLSDDYLKARAARIKVGQTFGPEFYGTREQAPDDGGTSHLCVIDSKGGAVACTETINLLFGSWVAVEPYGFMLNNQMDDFTTRRGEKNAFGLQQSDKNLPAPGKRPLSSMTPTIVVDADGRIEAVAGASGGPRIITATAQSLLNALLFDMSAGESVAHARVHHQWIPNVLEIEDGYPGRHEGIPLPIWMRKMHHQVVEPRDGAAVQLIKRTDVDAKTTWDAACDPRKGGRPAGR